MLMNLVFRGTIMLFIEQIFKDTTMYCGIFAFAKNKIISI